MITYGSLASGIGGLDLAIEANFDAKMLWKAEYDKYASQVHDKHWPNITNLHDITEVDWESVEPIDLLTGGYPCQPFSHAGYRKGFDDERNLWPHFAKAIHILRPKYVFLENVSGHLSLGFGQVLGDLAKEGYDAQWGVFAASSVGAPHTRKRLFIFAWDRSDDEALFALRVRTRNLAISQFAEENEIEQTDFRLLPTPVARDAKGVTSRKDGILSALLAIKRSMPASPVFDFGPYQEGINRWAKIRGNPPRPLIESYLNPEFVEWMMGFPIGWTEKIARTKRVKALGNAVVSQQGSFALSCLASSCSVRGKKLAVFSTSDKQ